QKLTGAPVYARRSAADVLRTGKLSAEDPQINAPLSKTPIPKATNVWNVNDDELLGVGSVRLRAMATPGHSPGGTSWTWDACEGDKCLRIVYADALSPASGPGFKFRAPLAGGQTTEQLLRSSIDRISGMKCDVLVTAHPADSHFLERVAMRPANDLAAIKDEQQCKTYAEAALLQLDARVVQEESGGGR
ncbi:MAG: hypothetical protein LBE59_01125, partial [Nevskiaceae bacterium]|nr:hypothetical protein [Nevskiaceae bacterium]